METVNNNGRPQTEDREKNFFPETNDYPELEEKLEYTFQNKALLLNALTHSSFASEKGKSYRFNNERLEFIGDAFLDAIVGSKIYDIAPDQHEGFLSKTRAAVVCERSLAEVAREIGLGSFIRLGHGEETGGGREKDSILADAMEAVIGAVFKDGGYEKAQRLVLMLFRDHIRLAVQGKLYKDYKTTLQEKLQNKYRNPEIEYIILDESGPDHDKSFTAQIRINGKPMGQGLGKSKKEAQQAAARQVILKGEF